MNNLDKISELDRLLGFKVPRDGFISALQGSAVIDIAALDDLLSKSDSEYDGKECLYKEEKVSMNEYVERKYGKRASELIQELC